tara:strand:- start:50 stop:682 length:633 start_codon:yes stop_codon:yes gene_type:complete
MGFVYALKLNNNDEYRYIGKTINIRKRFTSHKRSAKKGENLPVYRWMKAKGVENIELLVLEEADNESLFELERSWILKSRLGGHRLLNLTDGGEGAMGYRHTEKQKKEWSEERKGSIAGEKNPNYGKFGPAHPSYGRKCSEETKQRLSDKKRGENNPNYGKSASQETKLKMSLAQKGRPRPSSARSAHTRWHVNKNKASDACKYCKESNE